MILDTSQNQISKIFKKNEMGIKVDGLAHQMMIDGIYSNKLNSVFREISTNARDSHIESGNNNPFEIRIETTRNSNHCIVTISDSGTGLSEEEVLTYLCNLNSSSKRNSDTVVGCFGIGSKSVFSLTDKYTYECVKDGKLTNLLLTKDKNGTPNYTHTVSDTTLHNSVVCTFAINENFKNILEAIYIELALFDIKPVIKVIRNPNGSFVTEADSEVSHTNLYFEPDVFFPDVKEFDHYFIIDQSQVFSDNINYFDHKHLSCGIIGYKLDNYSTASYYRTGLNSSNRIGILPKFNLGEIKFGVSREIIENTNETINLLAKKYTDIYSTFPDSKYIADFIKVETGQMYNNSRANLHNIISERNLLLLPYKLTSTTEEEAVTIRRLDLTNDYFIKDYLTNKIKINNEKDLFIFKSFLSKESPFFKLYDKIPSDLFKNIAENKGQSFSDIEAFYRLRSTSIAGAFAEYYSGNIQGSKSLLVQSLISHSLSKRGIKYNLFRYDLTNPEAQINYVYSHKSLGSNTFLESLKHKDMDIIKLSRAQDLDLVDNLMPFLENLLSVSITHLDTYKLDHPEFFATLRPVKKVKVVSPSTTNTEIVDNSRNVSELGLRLRSKHDLFTFRTQESWSYNTTHPSILNQFKDSEALTSTQIYSKLINYVSLGLDLIFVSEELLEDYSVFNDYKKRYILIMASEQSDVEEITKIIKLIKSNNRDVYIIDDILNKETIDEFSPDKKAFLLEQAIHNYMLDLDKTVATLGDESYISLFRRLTSRRYSPTSTLSQPLGMIYFGKYNTDLIDFLSNNMDKFKIDFFNLEYLNELVSHYKSLIFSNNMLESITTLKKELYNDI